MALFTKRDKKYDAISTAFQKAPDTHLIPTRKSVFLNPCITESTTNTDTMLVYKKSDIRHISVGDTSIAPGYIVHEIIKDPLNPRDGFVLCIEP